MSLSPPPPSRSKIGDVWVDPISARRFVFTGENLDAINYGWVPWDLRNEQYEYDRAEAEDEQHARAEHLREASRRGGDEASQ